MLNQQKYLKDSFQLKITLARFLKSIEVIAYNNDGLKKLILTRLNCTFIRQFYRNIAKCQKMVSMHADIMHPHQTIETNRYIRLSPQSFFRFLVKIPILWLYTLSFREPHPSMFLISFVSFNVGSVKSHFKVFQSQFRPLHTTIIVCLLRIGMMVVYHHADMSQQISIE